MYCIYVYTVHVYIHTYIYNILLCSSLCLRIQQRSYYIVIYTVYCYLYRNYTIVYSIQYYYTIQKRIINWQKSLYYDSMGNYLKIYLIFF